LLAWYTLRRPVHRQIPTLLWIGTASLLGQFAASMLAVALPDSPWRVVVVDLYPFMLWAFVPGMVLAIVEARGFRLGHPVVLAAGLGLVAWGIGAHLQRLDIPTAIGAMLIIGWSLTRDLPATVARLATALGAISFGLYLWHFDTLQWVSRQGLDPMAATIVGLTLSVAVAVASYLIVERPAIGLARALTSPSRRLVRQTVATRPEERAATAAAPSS